MLNNCINKNYKPFKPLFERYGKVIAEAIIRKLSRKKGLPKGEFYAPSMSEARKFLQTVNADKLEQTIRGLEANPLLSLEGIRDYLQGVIAKKGDTFFIVKGMESSSVHEKITVSEIFKPNLRIMTELQKKYPNIFKLRTTPKPDTVVVEITPIDQKNNQLPLFNESGKEINRLSQYFTSDKSSSQKVLSQIAKLDGGLGTIARKLLENKLDIPIELIDVPNFTNNNLPEGVPKFEDENFLAAALYYQGKIYIAKQTKFKDSTEGTLLHEILHAYTYNYIKNNPNARSVQASEDLVKYLNQPEISKLLRDKYPLTNVDELLVGIFTNPKLIEDLKLLEPKNKNFKSVWDEILQIFKVIFGISDKTMFDEVFSAASEVLNESMNQMKDIEEVSEIQFEIKEGVEELFESNPELASIGTEEQYSQYLNQIFPNSIVKDIVYHGSNSKIEKFDTSKSKVSDVIYFSNDIREAKYYANKIPDDGIFVVEDYQYTYLRFEDKNYYLKKEVKIGKEKLSKQDAISKYSISEKEYKEAKNKLGNLNPSLINIKNLYQGFGEDLFFGGSEYFKENGFDGFITNNDSGTATILAVFEPEQIHILGSKQDIEGFKEFVNKQNRVLANESAENTGKQKLISNKLDDLQRKVIRNPIDNSVKVEGFENIEWIRPSTEAKGDIQRRSFGITTEKQEEFSKLSQDVGTLVHAIQADIIKKNFPEFNKHIPSFTSDTDLSDFYSSLEEQMQPVIDSAKKRGSILKAEVFIGNTKSKKGGTVDLLEITTDGDFIVYDTKTRYSPDKSAKRRLNKIQEWSVQTGIYGDILKTGDNSIGVVSGKFLGAYILEFEFEKLGDYVNMKFNGAPRSTTVEKFLSRRKATMKIVAPTFLRTKNEKINKTIDTLNRQISELVKQKGGTAEQIMQRDRILSAKIELMQSLQLKMDTQRLIDQAYEDLGTIKTMLDKGDLSDSSFINEQLTFYSTLRSQIEDLDEAKSREIKAIMADANELIEQYKELTIQVAKGAVTKSGVSETLEKMGKSLDEPVQDSGKMFMLLMPTSQVDDPYIAAAVATTNVQLAKAREKTVELFKLMQEKANAYKKATSLSTYDSMIEDGKLVGEYSKEFWKQYNDAKSLKDFGWASENLDFNKEEYQKARERQLNFYDAFRDTYKNQFKFKNSEATETEIDILVEKHIALEMKNWEDMNNNSFTYFKAKSKWANPKYVDLMKGPKEAKELYEMFKSLIEYANEVMPDRVKRNFIPSFQKDYIERLSSLNLMNAIPEMMSGLLDNISMNYDDELYGKRNPVTGEKIGEMWIPGTSDIRDKSLDLPVVFFKFMEGVYRFQELSAVEETVLSIQRVVKDRNYVKVDRLGRIVPDQKAPAAPKTAANNASMLQSYIDSTFYGVKRKDDVGFEVEGNGFTELLGILKKGDTRKISVGKIVDKMISYTTLRNLGFNLYSPIVNLVGGSANYWITGANGVYYSNAEFNKAIAMVLSKGVTPEGEKLNLILDWLQADTGEFIKEKTNELTTRKGAYLIEQYGPLSLMRESENVMKNVGAIAMLLSGKHGYTLDDFTVVDGKLEVNTDILSKEKFRQKVIRVNMKNLGGINPDDMMMVKQYIVGRMLMQHRSWLPSLFFDRFGRKRTDYILEQDIEGRYLTAFRLFKYYFNRSKFQELNDFEKANMKSAAMEAALLMGTGLLLFLLKAGLDDDDKKEAWAKITTKISSRAFSELLFFVDPTFESQYAILLNPAPVFGTTSDYAKFLGSMFNEENSRKKGPVERGIKLIPGVNKTTTFLEDLGLVDFDEK